MWCRFPAAAADPSGAKALRGSSISCVVGSRATTGSTSSASTPNSPRTCCYRCCARSTAWFRVRPRPGQHPRRGRRAVGVEPLGHLPFDALMTAVAIHDDHPAHRTCGCSAPTSCSAPRSSVELGRKHGSTLACHPDAERLLRQRRAGGGVAGGVQGHRQAVRGTVQAAAFRPRRLRVGGAAHRGADHPMRRSSAPRRPTPRSADIQPLARLLELPYFPVTPFFPLLGPLGAVPLPIEVAHRVRRTDPAPTSYGPDAADDPMLVLNLTDQVRETHPEPCTDAGPPPGVFTAEAPHPRPNVVSAFRAAAAYDVASASSIETTTQAADTYTGCGHGPATRSGPDRGHGTRHRARTQHGGHADLARLTAGAEVADLPAPGAGDVAQSRVRVDRHGRADHRQHRHVVHRVGVGGAAAQVQALADGQRPHRVRLGRAVQDVADEPAGVAPRRRSRRRCPARRSDPAGAR